MASRVYEKMGVSIEDCKKDCKIEDWKQLVVFDTEQDADTFADFIGGNATKMTNGYLVSELGSFVTKLSHDSSLAVAKKRYGISFKYA